ncbi:MAG: tetratricopeptide repeat protein [Verrucomicrobiae bacterium]|nr:tetratricopeptide repeat protein [Verrucomicrobiae bacterium]
MKTHPSFRKRRGKLSYPKNEISVTWQAITALIKSNEIAEALAELDSLAQQSATPEVRSQILALVGDCEFKRSKYEAAQKVYESAFQLVSGTYYEWLRPALGKIRAFLANYQVQEAYDYSQKTLSLAQEKSEAFQAYVSQLTLTSQTITVPLRPVNPASVAYRIGCCFREKGENEKAKEFFTRAVEINPNQAIPSQIQLAEIELRNHPQSALDLALVAIKSGQGKAKTIAAWPILIRALVKLNQPFTDSYLNILAQATPTLRSRAMLMIVRELRRFQRREWQVLADRWLQEDGAQDSSVAAEMQEMILSTEKQAVDVTAQRVEKAKALLQTPNLCPREWITAAKTIVETSCRLNLAFDLEGLMGQATNLFDPEKMSIIRHSIARSCFLGDRADLARPLLEQNLATVSSQHSLWGKTVWSLAQLSEAAEDYSLAAYYYFKLAQQSSQALRFRLMARLSWCECLIETGDSVALQAAQPEIENLLAQTQDFSLLMDFARKLRFVRGPLQNLAKPLFLKGETMARETFQKSSSPNYAVKILNHLTRRQVDFNHFDQTLALWHSLTPEKKQWLWSDKIEYWDYLSYVFSAYVVTKQAKLGKALAQNYLENPSTPVNGIGSLGVSYGLYQLNQGNQQEAFLWFEKVAVSGFSAGRAAYAHYWLALRAFKQNNLAEANRQSQRLLAILPPRFGQLKEKALGACALLIQKQLNREAAILAAPDQEKYIRAQWHRVTSDLERL